MAESVGDVLDAPWKLLSEQTSLSLPSRRQVIRDIEDRGRAEQRVRQDYSGRYPIELLQNAHDACADADQVGKAWFHFSPRALLIANQGVPFTAKRVQALMRLGSGTKTAGGSAHHTIGYKGIGFSAVFEITDNPQVVSDGVRFQFHRAKAATRIAELIGEPPGSLPVRGYPIELADVDLGEDGQVVASLLDRGAISVIRLPLIRHSPDEIAAAVRSALSPEVLLFMPHINQLEFSGAGHSNVWRKRSGKKKAEARVVHLAADDNSQAWLLTESRVEAPADAVVALDDELWRNVTALNVAVAVPWKAGRPNSERGPQPIHVYFPTRDLLGRAVLVHGDFYVDSSRTRIATSGPAGQISECVGAAAGRLLGGLVEQLGDHGKSVVDCLAVTGHVDGFGKRMGELLIAELLERRFLKALDGTGPKSPRELARMGQSTQLASRIARLLNRSDDLADVSLEQAPASDLLNELQMATVDPAVLASRVEPATVEAPYAWTLDVLQDWIESVSFANRVRLVSALECRSVVRNQRTEAWVPPGTVVHPCEGVPLLPAALHRDAVELPGGKHHPLFESFRIEELDAELALDTLLDAVEEEEFGTLERHPGEPLRYLWQLWARHPEVFRENDSRLRQVLLPVKSLTKPPLAEPSTDTWCDAGRVYFGPEWVADGTAAGIYGPLGVAEFLAEQPPRSKKSLTRKVCFFRALGVSAEPQLLDIDSIGSRDRGQWEQSPEYSAAVCPEHGTSRLKVRESNVPERLDDVLRSENRASLKALAQYLAGQNEPYGKRAEIKCTHGWHGAQRWRSVPSLQEFLLRNIPWVPVCDDPGDQDFRTPDEAWVLALEAHRRHLLPRADLDEAVSNQLRLPNSGRPQRAALEAGLRLLATLADEMETVPEQLWRTAEWLLINLDRALRDVNTVVPLDRRPPLPAFGGKTRTWDYSPLIPNVPGLDALPTISVLPPGPWPNIGRVYELALASELIGIKVIPHRTGPRLPPLLSESDRIDLVAYLNSAGGELEDLARRMGRLEQVPCSGIQLELSHQGETARVNRQYYLERTVERERGSKVARGRLYTAPDPPLDEISADLATTYLQRSALATDIHLYLLGREQVLRKVTEDDRAVAAQALHKYPFQADLIEAGTQSHAEGGADETKPQPNVAARTGDDQEPIARKDKGRPEDGPETDPGSRASHSQSGVQGDGQRAGRDGHRRPETGARQDATTHDDAGARSPRDRQDQGDGGGRNRMVSYIEPADHEPRSEDPERTARQKAIDDAGVAAVVDFETSRGRRPTVLPHGHPGYDVISGGEGSDGPERLIEIKSLDGSWDEFGVGMTPTQFETAQRKRDSYWLYVVEHARTAAPVVHTLQDPTAQVSSFRLDHKWTGLAVESVEVPRRRPEFLSDEEAAQFDDSLPVVDDQTIGSAGISPSAWIRCPGANRMNHFAAIISDRSLEPLAGPGDVVCVKAAGRQEADDVLSLVTVSEQGINGIELVLTVRTCVPEFDADGTPRAIVLHAHEGSGVPPLVVDDPGRLQIHGSFVGVIAGDVAGGPE